MIQGGLFHLWKFTFCSKETCPGRVVLQILPTCCLFMETPSTFPEIKYLAPQSCVLLHQCKERKRRNVFFHRAVESLRLVGTSGHHPVQPVLKAGSARAVCPGLNSCKDGKSTTSLGSQCQLKNPRFKKGFFKWHFLNFNLCPSPFGLSLDTTEKLVLSLHPPIRHSHTWIKSPSLGGFFPLSKEWLTSFLHCQSW